MLYVYNGLDKLGRWSYTIETVTQRSNKWQIPDSQT
jgi:hypothetical protein